MAQTVTRVARETKDLSNHLATLRLLHAEFAHGDAEADWIRTARDTGSDLHRDLTQLQPPYHGLTRLLDQIAEWSAEAFTNSALAPRIGVQRWLDHVEFALQGVPTLHLPRLPENYMELPEGQFVHQFVRALTE
jgi:hypothetical protein